MICCLQHNSVNVCFYFCIHSIEQLQAAVPVTQKITSNEKSYNPRLTDIVESFAILCTCDTTITAENITFMKQFTQQLLKTGDTQEIWLGHIHKIKYYVIF